MVKQTSILWTVVMGVGILSWVVVVVVAAAETTATAINIYNSSTKVDISRFPLGTTIVLKCIASEQSQQTQYNWTCPHGSCDNEYRKVYNNVIVLVVTNTTTTTSSDKYKCTLRYGNGTTFGVTVSNTVVPQTLGEGTIALYNNSKLLLQNTLITDPQQIPNGLQCVTGRSGSYGRFSFENGTTIIGTRQGQSTTIQTSQLNQNGQYQCIKRGSVWPFYIYLNNDTLPTPQVSLKNTSDEQQLQLQLNTTGRYNSGRFILRYNCQFKGSGPIEVEYKSVSASSDRIVTRNRSCFVEGQISTVTVWFVDGRNISSTPTVVNATRGEVIGGGESHSSSSRSVLPSATMALPSSLQTLPSSSLPQTPDALIPIIGAAAGGITLLLVSVLGIIICTIAIVRTRRGKRNSTTLHDQPVLYTTLQAGEQDVHEYTLPTGEHQQDNYNTGGLYDDVDVKLQPQSAIPSGCEENKDTTDTRHEEQRKGIKTDDNKMKKQDVQDPELLYAEVDKPKKKKKGKEKRIEEKKCPVDPQGETLYAEVNKPKKKGKKDKKAKVPQLIEQKQPSPPPDTGLGYEPSADSDSTPQQQDGEGSTTQPTPSATVEGLYAEVDKTQKKNKKKDEE